MANALEITKRALELWRSLHGNESLDQQCQRFDGYYWQWAWAGSERGLVIYPTATAAANASVMYSSNINDLSVRPGHLANWWWNPEGHVGTVVGFDNGRVLVSHTSSKGDTVLALSNNVKISHADTINLQFRGYSRTNGANPERTGLAPWPATDQETAKNAEEEDEEMQVGMYRKEGPKYIVIIGNPDSGFKFKYEVGSGGYNNLKAEQFKTGSFTEEDVSVMRVFEEALDAVRQGK